MNEKTVLADGESRAHSQPFVVFSIGGTDCALPVPNVAEVAVVSIAETPDSGSREVESHGRSIPLIDLSDGFGSTETYETDTARALILNEGDRRAALIVDDVSGVVRASTEAILDPPAFLFGRIAEFVTGIARTSKDRLILMLDAERVFDEGGQIASEAGRVMSQSDSSTR